MAMRRSIILALILTLGCGGGSDDSQSRDNEAPAADTPGAQAGEDQRAQSPAPLSLEGLRNARYPLLGVDPDTEVTLLDGEFVDQEAHMRAILGENWIARGDLNGDGRQDVALVLYFDTGGSGNFREFLVLTTHDGEAVVLGGVLAGDRVKLESFWMDDRALVVEMITHAPDDAMCCPTQRVRDRYILQDGELTRVSREELERVEP